jgi:hypothetical protein
MILTLVFGGILEDRIIGNVYVLDFGIVEAFLL